MCCRNPGLWALPAALCGSHMPCFAPARLPWSPRPGSGGVRGSAQDRDSFSLLDVKEMLRTHPRRLDLSLATSLSVFFVNTCFPTVPGVCLCGVRECVRRQMRICVCACVGTYEHTYMCQWICLCVLFIYRCTYKHMCMCVYICACTHTCLYLYICVYMYLCQCAHRYMNGALAPAALFLPARRRAQMACAPSGHPSSEKPGNLGVGSWAPLESPGIVSS